MSVRSRLSGASACAALLLVAAPAGAASLSLPSVRSGHRPGPDALYLPAPRAPQLENTAPWKADPILVSGASAYRDGEFLYQDYLYDDHGAAGVPDPNDPFQESAYTFSPKTGTLTYPTGAAYANNAADLVELRVRPLANATAFRITLNTMKDPNVAATTIALGSSPAPRAWPHGAGVSSPAAYFLTIHGSSAELLDAATGRAVTPAPVASVDQERRQIDVRVPQAAWFPGRGVVRMAAGVGLWDAAAGAYAAPGPTASATQPGGGAPGGAALFNVAFRPKEDVPNISLYGLGITIADAAVGAKVEGPWWREHQQAAALASGDVSPFSAQVDFGKLRVGTDDESAVPRAGAMDRIFASRYTFGQGVDYTKECGGLNAVRGDVPCTGNLVGQLQPYAIYVPDKPKPAHGYGMTLLLHSLSANYNQYLASHNQSQLGDRGAGTIVATPAGRGPDGFNFDLAEADDFEVWADVARHFDLDPSWSVVTGYSMGGFGTYRLMTRWPDLFARGWSVVGQASPLEDLPSLRNTPILSWNAAADELNNVEASQQTVQRTADLGLRFQDDLFVTADHLTLATNDEYGPGAAWLGDHRVDLDPPHVTYVRDASLDSARADAIGDHAYWLSDIRLPAGSKRGQVDATSAAFGAGDAKPLGVTTGTGTLEGGSHGPMPYTQRAQDWGAAPAAPKRDALVVRAQNIAAITVDAARAHLSCAPQLDLQSNVPIQVRIVCPPAPAPVRGASACTQRMRLALPRVKGRRIVSVRVLRGKKTLKRASGRNLRTIAIRRPTKRAFTLRIAARVAGGGRVRTVTLTRRYRAC